MTPIESPAVSRVRLEPPADFPSRHVGPDEAEIAAMLAEIGVGSLDELTAKSLPAAIRLKQPLALPAPLSEEQALAELARKAGKNKLFRSFLGMGYSDCHTPAVILRNVPRLTPRNRDRAWRFTTLVDALYEKKVKLICSAEAAPDKLYVEGDGAFEFQRVVSRLMEMQSPEYLGLEHIED